MTKSIVLAGAVLFGLVGTAYAQAGHIHEDGHEPPGLFFERAAHAELAAAYAERMRIENVRLRVQTYFDIRDINRAWHESRRPPPLPERISRREAYLEDLLLTDDPAEYQHRIQSGDALHFFFNRLFGVRIEFAADAIASLDLRLTRQELAHVRLTDTDGRFVFTPLDPAPLQVASWPMLLRGEEYAALRDEFIAAREQAVEQLGGEPLPLETQRRLTWAVEALIAEFGRNSTSSPWFSCDEWLARKEARDFLETLEEGVQRLVAVNDPHLLDPSLVFEQGTFRELLIHMAQHGLRFAPAEDGDARTYEALFRALREAYAANSR